MNKEYDNNQLGLQCKAMATVFEVFAFHEDPEYAKQAIWSAFDLLKELEQQLSFFIPNSDISRINSADAGEKIIVSEATAAALRQCRKLREITFGAFDIIAAGAYRNGRTKRNGRFDLEIDADKSAVVKPEVDIKIDMGGFGKGFAVDMMAENLREWSVENFLIHGGKSSAYATGNAKETAGWSISLTNPFTGRAFETVNLISRSISASGLKKGEHIYNPIDSKPLKVNKAVWALADSAGMSDGLSTAFIILDEQKVRRICERYGFGCIIVNEENDISRFNF